MSAEKGGTEGKGERRDEKEVTISGLFLPVSPLLKYSEEKHRQGFWTASAHNAELAHMPRSRLNRIFAVSPFRLLQMAPGSRSHGEYMPGFVADLHQHHRWRGDRRENSVGCFSMEYAGSSLSESCCLSLHFLSKATYLTPPLQSYYACSSITLLTTSDTVEMSDDMLLH
ncbi:hypothetical protein KUCAC02_012118 [Chaenocephalus aceratus]|uniref:Uncharacterized protein n=1 Tax=Chaenocephalus aceratus TaxID=36190 RepID=A0ACB9X9J2_CHAAC|nr:hypothetical protein KUCAC02_012118 [Chaenocephalus aceratus]